MKKSYFISCLLALALSCRFTIDGEDSTGGATSEPTEETTQTTSEPLEETSQEAADADAAADAMPQQSPSTSIHPAHRVLDEMETELNALGAYAISRLQHMIVAARNLL